MRRKLGVARRSIRVGALFSVAWSLAAFSCGGSSNVTPSGCTQGATQSCVGPAQCPGAQTCNPNGSWSACDCGSAGSGGTAGSAAGGGAGTSTAGGATTAGGAGLGGSAGASAGTGGGVQGGDGGMAGSLGEGGSIANDPCPTGPILVNCSDSCGPKSPECDTSVCSSETELPKGSWAPGDVVIRTPSDVSTHCKCTRTDEPWKDAPVVWGFAVKLNDIPNDNVAHHISVSPPWYIGAPGTDQCAVLFKRSCYYVNATLLRYVGVWTDQENAPSVNVTVEDGLCPTP